MPTYQYTCTDCGERLEVVQKFTDEALTLCPVCDGRLRKVFSAVGIVFKGSGFYRTDSRAAANGSKGSKESAESKDSTKSKESTKSSKEGVSAGSGDGGSSPAKSASTSAA